MMRDNLGRVVIPNGAPRASALGITIPKSWHSQKEISSTLPETNSWHLEKEIPIIGNHPFANC